MLIKKSYIIYYSLLIIVLLFSNCDSTGDITENAPDTGSQGDGSSDDSYDVGENQVFTCRYASQFTTYNCADFPVSEGWTEEDVEEFCSNLFGAKPESVEVSTGDSCLAEMGGEEGIIRCKTEDNGHDWYAYDVPAEICTDYLNGTPQTGPFITIDDDTSGDDDTPGDDDTSGDDDNDAGEDEFLTCRYGSIFADNNCADFPVSEGWTAEAVEEFCKDIYGTEEESVVVSADDSCLAEMGALEDMTRCKTANKGQDWYAYAVPEEICTGFLSGTFETGPFGINDDDTDDDTDTCDDGQTDGTCDDDPTDDGSGDDDGDDDTNHPPAVPTWVTIESNPAVSSDLRGIWGSSENDIYVVGPANMIIHFNGTAWSADTIDTEGRALNSVWGLDAGNVLATADTNRTIFYNWGNGWVKRSSNNNSGDALYKMWGSDAQNIIAAGNNRTYTTYHYNINFINLTNTANIGTSTPSSDVNADRYGVWGTSANNIYVVGENGCYKSNWYGVCTGRSNVMIWNGSKWRHIETGNTATLYDIWGTADNNIFAVGSGGTILHYNGSAWSSVSSPVTVNLNAVWGASGNDIYAVGDSGTVIYYNGTEWKKINEVPTGNNLNDVWGVSDQKVFIVGNGGTILQYSKSSTTESYTVWCDPDTDLCWQDPQRKAYDYDDTGVRSKEAIQYCEELVLGGFDDWRVPTVTELRSIIAGNTGTEEGGPCPVDEDCTFLESWNIECQGSDLFGGPGVSGCYLKDGLTGTCDKLDAYSAGHNLETFALTEASDNDKWVSTVMFDLGAVIFNHTCTVADIRCVRTDDGSSPQDGEQASCSPGASRSCPCDGYNKPDGDQVCSEDGGGWSMCECTDFTPDPDVQPDCYNFVCDESDSVNLTINLPGTLPYEPHMLIAFYYDGDTWEFPPARPPDGGTWYNQVINPGMPPYTMKVPACTYYQEYSLEGDYYLYVHVQQDEAFPPIPVCGDFWWGEYGDPISFPLDGVSHKGSTVQKNIMLEPLCGCPEDAPYQCANGECVSDSSDCCPVSASFRCGDGSCVSDAGSCPSCGDGQSVPGDDGVLTCRYESSFTSENCADFPISEGWTASQVDTFCKNQQGAKASTVVVTQGDSCLVEKGNDPDMTRCKAASSGKDWYAYEAPGFVCNMLGGSTENGSFCEEY